MAALNPGRPRWRLRTSGYQRYRQCHLEPGVRVYFDYQGPMLLGVDYSGIASNGECLVPYTANVRGEYGRAVPQRGVDLLERLAVGRFGLGRALYLAASAKNSACISLVFRIPHGQIVGLRDPRRHCRVPTSWSGHRRRYRRRSRAIGMEWSMRTSHRDRSLNSEDFEILGLPAIRSLRVVERVDQADAFDWSCLVPLTMVGCGSCAASRIVGTISITCENCERSSPLGLDAVRPGYDHAVAGAAEIARDLLRPLEGVFIAQPHGTAYRFDGFQVP